MLVAFAKEGRKMEKSNNNNDSILLSSIDSPLHHPKITRV